jgi:hypothetical protein
MAHIESLQASLNLDLWVLAARTVTITSIPEWATEVTKHGPAAGVIPVLIPLKPLEISLLVFFQRNFYFDPDLHSSFPSMFPL